MPQYFRVVTNDCNSGIEFSIPGSGIEEFVITVCQDPVSGLDLQIGRYFGIYSSLISCIRCGRLVRKVCQNCVRSDCVTVKIQITEHTKE